MNRIKLNVSTTVEELFREFLISRKAKGLADKTLTSYQSRFQAIARHLDVSMDIAPLPRKRLAVSATGGTSALSLLCFAAPLIVDEAHSLIV